MESLRSRDMRSRVKSDSQMKKMIFPQLKTLEILMIWTAHVHLVLSIGLWAYLGVVQLDNKIFWTDLDMSILVHINLDMDVHGQNVYLIIYVICNVCSKKCV